MKNQFFAVLALFGMLAACRPVKPVNLPGFSASRTPGETASLPSTRTPLATKPPVTLPVGPTANATPVIPATVDSPPMEEVHIRVLTPSLTIGKGVPTSLAVSPDGKWMAVSTQFGVYQYHAGTFEQAWFTPFEEQAGLVVFNGRSDRLGVRTGSTLVILDAATGSLLTSLEDGGSSFAWSPDGQRLVSGGGCEQVTVWDAAKAVVLKELRGDKCSEGYSGINVTWAASGTIYASRGSKFLTWNGQTYIQDDHLAAEGVNGTLVSALHAAPVGQLIAQYDNMGPPIIAIIDEKQDQQLHLLDQKVNGPVTSLSWAPDGQRLAAAYGMSTGMILIWNAQTGEVEQKIEGFYTAVDLGWSSDGQTLFGLQSLDGQIHAMEVSTGRVLRRLSGHAPAGNFLTWTQRGLVSTNGANLTWWNPSSGQPLRQETPGSPENWVISWPPAGPKTYLYYSSPLQAQSVGTLRSKWRLASEDNKSPFVTTWSWDGARLAGPTGVWDAQSGELLTQLLDPAQQHNPDQVAWSPDGSRLASADSLNMQSPVIWDARTGAVLHTLPAETGQLNPLWLGLAWSPDGKELAAVGSLMDQDVGTDDGMILIWDAQTGQQKHLLTAAMHDIRLWTVAWSPDSRFLACGTTGSELFVWDMINHTPLARLQGHRDVIDRLSWSPDGNRLASVARDGTLQIWDLASFIELSSETPWENR